MTEWIGCGLRSAEGESIPLRSCEMVGEVSSGQLRVVYRQRYENRETRPLEAIYVFPVPSEASVISFGMECGERRLKSQLREREAAFEAYHDAVQSGDGAALLEYERSNVFTASVGNLLPGESATIEIEYIQRLHAQEGALRVVLPTLVAPRYIPGVAEGDRTAHGAAEPTSEVQDADRITPRVGAADYTLSLDLRVHADVALAISSPSHPLDRQPIAGGTRVRLADERVPLDRDLIVVVEAEEVGAELRSVSAHKQGDSGYVSVSCVPDLARELSATSQYNLDVAFVLDRSGSMEGASIDEALKALRLCLRQLREGDRFSILTFSDDVKSFRTEPVPFTQKTLEEADAWLAKTRAAGGTELLEPLLSALDGVRSSAPAREGCVVLLTDGQVGNEATILKKVLQRGPAPRVYAFGIGTNVSDALLTQLASKTHGAVEFIHPGERIDEKVVATFARAIAPRVRDLRVEWIDLNVSDLAPAEPPPIVDGEPWSWSGRYKQSGNGALALRGVLRGEPWSMRVPVTLPAAAEAAGLPQLWAAERIRDLEAAQLTGASLAGRITKLALEHGIASRYTSFVVIEERDESRRAKDAPQARPIPVHAPAGWAMFARQRPVFLTGAMLAVAPRMLAPAPYGAAVGGGSQPMLRTRLAMDARASAPDFAPASQRAASDSFGSRNISSRPPSFSAGSAEPELRSPARGSGGGGHGVLGFASSAPNSLPVTDPRSDREHDLAYGILSRQLASGLWDREPEVDASEAAHAQRPHELAPASAAEHLHASASHLLELLRLAVDASHPQYGPQIRKAVAELLPLAAALTGETPDWSERAFAVAWLVSTGRRTRRAIRDAIRNAGLSALDEELRDEAALRGRILG